MPCSWLPLASPGSRARAEEDLCVGTEQLGRSLAPRAVSSRAGQRVSGAAGTAGWARRLSFSGRSAPGAPVVCPAAHGGGGGAAGCLSWDLPSLWPAVNPVPSPGQGYRVLSFTTALQCLPDAESRTVGPNKP